MKIAQSGPEEGLLRYYPKQSQVHTWVAMYTIDVSIMLIIPCKQALSEYVGLVSFSMELGEVKTCL